MRRSKFRRLLFNRSNAIALGILLLCLLICLWLLHPPLNQWMANLFTPNGFRQIADQLGGFSPLAYVVLIALSVVISPIPGAPLAIIAGALWGTVLASVYSIIGGFIGSLIAYYLGHTLGRSTIKALMGSQSTSLSEGEKFG